MSVTALRPKGSRSRSGDAARGAAPSPSSGSGDTTAAGPRALSAFYAAPPVFALGGALQAKVEVGEVGDPYEREADTVADRVVQGAAVPDISTLPAQGLAGAPQTKGQDDDLPAQPSLLQRQDKSGSADGETIQTEPLTPADPEQETVQTKCEDCAAADSPHEMEVQTKSDEPEVAQTKSADDETVQARSGTEDPIQAKPADEPPLQTASVDEDKVQAKSNDEAPLQASAEDEEPLQTSVASAPASAPAAGPAPAAPSAPVVAESAIRASGPGSTMHSVTRQRLESGMGQDFSEVRVHEDPPAHRANAALKSRAFTHGSHIWLGRGESQNDIRLMAHESTHVLQQQAVIRRKPAAPGDAAASDDQAPTGASTAGPATAPVPSPGVTGGSAAPAGPAATGVAAGTSAQPGPAPSAPASVQPAAGAAPGEEGAAGGGGAAQTPAGAPAGAPAPSGPGPAAAGASGELLMPEPPADLSAAERERIADVEDQASAATAATESMPSPGETVDEARGAVEEPEAETAARAASELTATLGERAAPSPEIEDLCVRIRELIRSKRPPDEESLVELDPRAAAESAGGQLTSSVEGDADRVQDDYAQLEQEPEGTPQQQAEALETPPGQVETPPVNATRAVPDAVPAEDVSLDADVAAQGQRMDEAGMATEPAALIEDPASPVVQAREAQGELGAVAERAPAEVLAEQGAARDQARGEMQSLQQRALEELRTTRGSTAGEVGAGMVDLGTTEEEMRTNAGNEARRIFTDAQSRVDGLLDPLPQTAMRRWETGIQVLSTRVEQQSTEFNRWKRERYSGVGGTALEVVEYFTGLPDWAIEWLNDIERSFGDDVCDLIREISTEVNSVISTCEEIIDTANRQIAEVFARLPASLQEWAAGQQAGFSAQLEGLRNRANSTREDFNRDLTQQAAQSVQQVRESIHAMRQEALGLIGQIGAAIEQFAEDPARFIINGLLKLVGISPGAFWALVDRIGEVIEDIADNPLNFANNLAAALGQGFQRFFDNFSHHILGGFFDWLFSGLGAVGVQIPSDFSLGSLITFFLQLMGITWARVREILARHIGEENVALLEKAYELIATLMEQGVDGIYAMVEQQLNPRTILDAVLSAAVDFLIEALIRAVTPRIIALFNPAGAIAQAVEVIYRILAWVFQNAARIFSLVETVVNGAAQLIAGNASGMAAAVESALARLIAPVIDFLAGFLGLGNLPDRIADTIGGFQEMVLSAIDRVVAWLAERARALLRALGIGGDDEEPLDEEDREKAARVREGLSALDREEQSHLTSGKLEGQEAESVAAKVKREHPVFRSLVVVDGGATWNYRFEASPAQEHEGAPKSPDECTMEEDLFESLDSLYAAALAHFDRDYKATRITQDGGWKTEGDSSVSYHDVYKGQSKVTRIRVARIQCPEHEWHYKWNWDEVAFQNTRTHTRRGPGNRRR